jgi:DMSO reductase family type II enzyme chaperone
VIYKELSLLYIYPDKAIFDEIKKSEKDFSAAFDELYSQCAFRHTNYVRELLLSVKELSVDEAQAEYVRLFDYNPSCPPYESSYVKLEKGGPAILHSVLKNFYNTFGLNPSQSFTEPSDHISVELEFMHFLTFKEGQSFEKDSKGVEMYLAAEKDFCDNHLIKWVPGFCNCLNKYANVRFYNLSALLTRDFILHESEYINSIIEDVE